MSEHDEREMTEGSRAMSAANLFDLRRIIGGVFTALGILLIILGLTESQAEIDKAAGININLYAGLGMLALGLLFLLWAFTRPLGEQLAEGEPTGSMSSPPPQGVDAAALGTPRRRPTEHDQS